MTILFLILGFLAVIALLLLAGDSLNKKGWAHNKALADDNQSLRALVHEIHGEALAQFGAGNPEFAFLVQLIDESGQLTPTRKALPE